MKFHNKKLLTGSVLTILTLGSEQGLRFLTNIALANILYPEAIGLIAIANVVLVGLVMVSDVGLEQAVITSQNSRVKAFLGTVWTLQFFRGLILWGAACALAYPLAVFYEKQELIAIIASMGCVLFLKGMNSVGMLLAIKEMDYGKLAVVNISTAFLVALLSISLSYLWNSVWSIVIGNVLGTFLALLISHYIFRSVQSGVQIQFDRGYYHEVLKVGKWIVFGGVAGFIVNQADRLIVGKVMGVAELGVYAIAASISLLPRAVLFALSGKVLMPLYVTISENHTILRHKITRVRFAIIAALLPIPILLSIFGSQFSHWILPDTFDGAGWMIQLLSLAVMFVITMSYGPMYLGLRKNREFALDVLWKSFSLILSMLICSHLFGANGVILGVAISVVINYFYEAYFAMKFGIYNFKMDFFLFILMFIYLYFLYEVGILGYIFGKVMVL